MATIALPRLQLPALPAIPFKAIAANRFVRLGAAAAACCWSQPASDW